ncbi:hypothetical protein T07_2117 [Trichinella nelsoni]|uniref:Uncharacterized protein n=2 Tax=Trichinella TaxID=6333 RepID=A0A0V0SC90_9BILA|nr:hypothetical protein T07_2117 [Trichinella nelsoni]KRY28015.1 hypothetical protein T01_555 [Trichinella spiralis]
MRGRGPSGRFASADDILLPAGKYAARVTTCGGQLCTYHSIIQLKRKRSGH